MKAKHAQTRQISTYIMVSLVDLANWTWQIAKGCHLLISEQKKKDMHGGITGGFGELSGDQPPLHISFPGDDGTLKKCSGLGR